MTPYQTVSMYSKKINHIVKDRQKHKGNVLSNDLFLQGCPSLECKWAICPFPQFHEVLLLAPAWLWWRQGALVCCIICYVLSLTRARSITEFLQVRLPRLLVFVPCHHNSVFAMYTMCWLGLCKSSLTFDNFSSPHVTYNVPSTKDKSMHTYMIPHCEGAMVHERGMSYIKRWCFVSGVNSSKQVLVNVHAYIWHVQGVSCVLPGLIKPIQVNRVTILFETIAENWKR